MVTASLIPAKLDQMTPRFIFHHILHERYHLPRVREGFGCVHWIQICCDVYGVSIYKKTQTPTTKIASQNLPRPTCSSYAQADQQILYPSREEWNTSRVLHLELIC
ncbi:hypothetical protein MRB53_033668 [Persea americana]|uniref:Uncharacterized protein n=1 Tax=Persea americana TaxID=3435 RepID=A0ACC2KVW5_PERAE|nr:hypothetical protein MRB53_033668 [Persea americana]